jgi:hypothetical protein
VVIWFWQRLSFLCVSKVTQKNKERAIANPK